METRLQGPMTVVGQTNGVPYPIGADWPLPGGATILDKVGGATFDNFNDFSGVSLVHGALNGFSYARSVPPSWTTGSLSFGTIEQTSSGGLLVKFRIRIKRTDVFGPNADTSVAAQIDQTFTYDPGTANILGHVFNTPGNFQCQNVGSFFGSVMSVHIERMGNDAGDTYLQPLLITNVNILQNT